MQQSTGLSNVLFYSPSLNGDEFSKILFEGITEWVWRNWEDDLVCCLGMKTMNWTMTMGLRISDTFANVRFVVAI